MRIITIQIVLLSLLTSCSSLKKETIDISSRFTLEVREVLEQETSNTTKIEFETPSSTIYIDNKVLLNQNDVLKIVKYKNEYHCGIRVILTENGKKKFLDITTKHQNQKLAFFVNNRYMSSPYINSPIRGGNFQVFGFSESEVDELIQSIYK